MASELKDHPKYLGARIKTKKAEILPEPTKEPTQHYEAVNSTLKHNHSKTTHFFRRPFTRAFKENSHAPVQSKDYFCVRQCMGGDEEETLKGEVALNSPVKGEPVVGKQSESVEGQRTGDRGVEKWTLKRSRLRPKDKLEEYREELRTQVNKLGELRSLLDAKMCPSCADIIRPIVQLKGNL